MGTTAHEWHQWTRYCTRCGCPMTAAVEGRECSPANVIAVSHILSERRFERLIGRHLGLKHP